MITNTHTWRFMQAGATTSKLQPGHWQKPSRSSAAARPNGPREGPGTPGGRDRAAHELGRVRKPGTGNRKLEKDAEGGRTVFMVAEKSSEARAPAPSLIRRPLNPGTDNATKITNKSFYFSISYFFFYILLQKELLTQELVSISKELLKKS